MADAEPVATEPAKPAKVTSADVITGLRSYFPWSENVVITEAPDGPGRQGRKLDLVAISCWKSRGYEVDGIEVKISVSDWRRELREAAKADWWYQHVNRFWIAAPADVATKIRPELPSTWGLLALGVDGQIRRRQAAEQHVREPFDWPETIGLMRALKDVGQSELNAARKAGIEDGRLLATADGIRGDPKLNKALSELDDLRSKVQAFEDASGFKLSDARSAWLGARQLGRIAKMLVDMQADPARMLGDVERQVEQLRHMADGLDRFRGVFADGFPPLPDEQPAAEPVG